MGQGSRSGWGVAGRAGAWAEYVASAKLGDGTPAVAAEGRWAVRGGWRMIRFVLWKNRVWRHGVSAKAESPSVTPPLMALPVAGFSKMSCTFGHPKV